MADAAQSIRRGRALHAQGNWEQAELCYRDALRAEPDHPEAWTLLGAVAMARGDLQTAESAATRALEAAPRSGEARYLLGRAQLAQGDWIGARDTLLVAASVVSPAQATAQRDLALCHAKLNAWPAALAAAEEALTLLPGDEAAGRVLAEARYRLGQLVAALEAYDRLLARNPADASAWHATSIILLRVGRAAEAHERAARAASLAPENRKYAELSRQTAVASVPDWHFNMMNDTARNTQFAGAITEHVKPGMLVLEIGTGAGLLAMLAARGRRGTEGARHVVSCESNPIIADAARRIIAKNGLAERITVIAKPSTELVVGVDLPEPADLLVSEIFSVQIVAEGVLQSFEDAKARLLKPNAPIVPARAIARGALVGGEELARMARVSTACGYDVSEFNEFTPPHLLVSPGQSFTRLSEPMPLLTFDLARQPHFPAEQRSVTFTAIRSGSCEGVMQWLCLELDDRRSYEQAPEPNGPSASPPARHWAPIWYPFPAPVPVVEGQRIEVSVSHNRFGVSVRPRGWS